MKHIWKELYDSLTIKPPYGAALPIPKDADLDRAEKAIGFKLPAAYREYAKLFGLGEHSGYFRIYVPLGSKFPNADLAGRTAKCRETFAAGAGSAKEKAIFRRMIPFASSVGGDVFFFDPGAAETEDANYAVFAQIKGHAKIVKAADDFKSFMNSIVYKKGGLEKLTKSKEIMDPVREFAPYGDKVRGL